uniref:PGG domain-containing protein n=2 Tax=Arundo donax TaxID=35708 RepID=A0A0A8ZCU0_ARUDO
MEGCTATTSCSLGGARMGRRLLEAATSGDATTMKHMALHDPTVLLGTTPVGNTCLHISSIHGHQGFCEDVVAIDRSLLTAVNADGETPLLAAVTSSHVSLASFFLRYCRDHKLSEAMLKQDKRQCNALHHAVRSGHRELTLELLAAEPALSRVVNEYNESPLFIAVRRDFVDVFEELLKIPDYASAGPGGQNVLHEAVINGNSVILKRILETHPELAREENMAMNTPVLEAVLLNRIGMLSLLLEHDCSLGYLVNTEGTPLLVSAAFRGHVGVARELLNHCPDAPYCDQSGWTCLHQAAYLGHTEFVEFVLRVPQLRKLVNMRDEGGKTALHCAMKKCNPKVVAALLFQNEIDISILDNDGNLATWELFFDSDHAKTLNWNEVCMLMLKADPKDATSIHNLHEATKDKVADKSRNDVKSLTQTYTSNTSIVAILITTITFAAAFTLPGGYSTDAGSEGLPIMARKFVFQAFLISDTLAMCSSLAVAFICIVSRWEDFEFLLYYRAFTKKLMWFAYMATTTAFATGLYTVLAPRLRWLAIAICILPVLLPILTKLLGEWPILKLRYRLGQTFKPELLDMV